MLIYSGLARFLKEDAALVDDLQRKVVATPLAGEDLFVTEKLPEAYAEGVESFFLEIADHFASHADKGY